MGVYGTYPTLADFFEPLTYINVWLASFRDLDITSDDTHLTYLSYFV